MEQDFISEVGTKVTSSFRMFDKKQHHESKSNTHYSYLKTTCLPQRPHQHLSARSLSMILFKLRSGYCKIGDALHYQPFHPCPGCGSQDSTQHFLGECSAYDAQRQRMKSQLPLSLRKRPLSVQLLLEKPRSTTREDLRMTASLRSLWYDRAALSDQFCSELLSFHLLGVIRVENPTPIEYKFHSFIHSTSEQCAWRLFSRWEWRKRKHGHQCDTHLIFLWQHRSVVS